MKKKILTAAFLLAVMFANAQVSALSAGGEAQGAGGSASHSIGLPTYTADIGNSGSASHGVQHAYEVFDLTGSDAVSTNVRFSVYPNPTENMVHVSIKDNTGSGFSYTVFSLEGRMLSSDKLHPEDTEIAMKNFPAGTYMIKITHLGKPVKTFKIIKNQ